MKHRKRWKKAGAAFLTLALLTGNIQGMLIRAEEKPILSYQEEVSEKEEAAENRSQETEEEIKQESENQTEVQSETQMETASELQSESQSETEIREAEETEKASEPESEADSEAVSETASEKDSEQETDTEAESETESESETEDPYGIALQAKTETPSGNLVSKVSGWKAVTFANRFSADYLPVKFYPGISSLEVFHSSDQVVQGTTTSKRNYLYPKTTGQGGKFGAIYRKVLYSNHRWYDLKMTVTNYTSKIHYDGGGTMESYPFILMLPSVIEWRFNQSIGGIVMKCEFLDSLTGAVSPVNTRFQWWDVDSAQRFGMKTGDGKIAGKYYYSGSKVYVESNATIAGVKNLEVCVGPVEDSESTDPNYCVTYELQNCSTYYMAIGPRDHIDNDEYSYAKSHVQELNDKLKNATANTIDSSQTLLQTDTSLTIIDTPAPEKSVSTDGKKWGTENSVSGISDAYWYQIRQFVPWQSSKAYYQSLSIQDSLPKGVEYVGNIRVIREEDGKDMTGNFQTESKDGNIKATASAGLLGSNELYGYHFLLQFQVRLAPGLLTPQYSGNTALYSVKNTAKVVYQHKTDGKLVEKKSNEVTTKGSVSRKEQPVPEKYLDQTVGKKEKNMSLREDELLFTVRQVLPENEKAFLAQTVTLQDKLESCLELIEAKAEMKQKGKTSFSKVENAQIQQTGEKLTVKVSLNAEDNGGTLQFQIRCRIRKGTDLSPWKKTATDGSTWVRIPNKADVTVGWEKGTPAAVTKSTNQVQANLRINHIRLTKKIQTADIVWAHGNPTFTFTLKGTDAAGKQKEWHQTVEFTKEKVSEKEMPVLTVDFEVPAGTYEASEEKTMRYRLEEISQVQNGTNHGKTVTFALQNGGDGSAVFYNQKTTDAGESHTAFVRNKIG